MDIKISTAHCPFRSRSVHTVHGSLILGESAGDQILNYYLFKLFQFCESIGIDTSKLRFREQLTDELAHYATVCYDLECRTNIGWVECAGLANRKGSSKSRDLSANPGIEILMTEVEITWDARGRSVEP